MNAFMDSNLGRPYVLGLTGYTPTTRTLTQLSTAYVHGTSGTAVGFRFFGNGQTLTDLWIFMQAKTGTNGAMVTEIRNDATNIPGTTVLATQSTTWTNAGTWTHVTFSSPATLTAGTMYWIVVSNAAATPATNNFTMMQSGSVTRIEINQVAGPNTSKQTTGGWLTGNSNSSNIPVFVAKFGDGTYMGNPYTLQNVAYTSNSRERGILLDALPFDVTLRYVQVPTVAQVSGLKIYKGSTIPGGTTYGGPYTVDTNSLTAYTGDIVLVRKTQHRIVLTFSTNSISPGSQWVVEDSNSDVLQTAIHGGRFYSTIDNGAGGWTDSANLVPQMSLFISRILPGGNCWSAAV